MKKVEQLSSHLYLIDDFDLQHNERTGTYVLLGDDITLIETCAAPSLPYILDGLQQLHIDLNDVKNIIVTHVHLDHAGAAGLMMEKCPNATLYVHSRGARHMIDPTKLILGAKAVYKEDFDEATKALQTVLMDKISSHLTTLNVPADHSVYNILHLDIEISAMGIIDYFTKQEKANSTIN
ncbi:MBL fold metallo-hydrolase [Bacillus cereus]|nr:MBL fold metallo-hydrolase [Bacillus cereus]